MYGGMNANSVQGLYFAAEVVCKSDECDSNQTQENPIEQAIPKIVNDVKKLNEFLR